MGDITDPSLGDLSLVFQALADPTRIKVFAALVGCRCVVPTLLARLTQTSVSLCCYHLQELVRAGLASEQRSGKLALYSARTDKLSEVVETLARLVKVVDEPQNSEGALT